MRNIISLNREWKFKERHEEKDLDLGLFKNFVDVELPHTQKILPFNGFDINDYLFKSTYKRIVNIEKKKGKSYILRFLGIAQSSIVFVNGTNVKENKCGYNEITIDITPFIKKGENEIAVIVDSGEGNFPPFGDIVDYLGYGGIYRECYLEETDFDYIINPFFYATDLLSDKPRWHFSAEFSHSEYNFINIFVNYNQKNILSHSERLLSGLEVSGELREVTLWDINNPKLYDVVIELIKDNKVADSITFKFGFRDVQGDKSGFYLNGEKLLLRGLDRHQSYPYIGYAAPVSEQIYDAHLLKYDLGVNSVRCSHYMNHPKFLEECDKIGLIVYEEIPGWQYIGDDEWKKQASINLDDMILRDRNHPSIAFFGVRINESRDDKEFNIHCYQRAKELDPTRIITGTRAHKKGLDNDDCYTYNNFFVNLTSKRLYRKSEVTKKRNPYLIAEYCGHMFPNKVYDNEERRVEASIIHKNIIEKVRKENDIFGAMGWVFADYNTHKGFGPNDMICYHGVLDMFRNPKISSYVYSALGDKPFLEVSSSMGFGDYDESIPHAPYIYTSCDKVEVYSNEKLISTYFIDDDINKRIFPFTDTLGNSLVEVHHESKRFQKEFKKTAEYILLNGFKNKFKIFLHSTPRVLLKLRKYGLEYVKSLQNTTFTFLGYKNGEVVTKKQLGYGTFSHLDVRLNHSLNITDTFDMCMVKVKACDNLLNTPRYITDPVMIDVSDGLQIVGPNMMSLIGGFATFYIKTKKREASKENIKIKCSRVPEISLDIDVKSF